MDILVKIAMETKFCSYRDCEVLELLTLDSTWYLVTINCYNRSAVLLSLFMEARLN